MGVYPLVHMFIYLIRVLVGLFKWTHVIGFLYPKHAQYLQDSLVCGRPN